MTSAVLGTLGAVIVGWLTTRERVFPAWVGWVFLAQGLLNFIAGSFDFGSLASVFRILLPGLQAIALLAYGYFISRNKRHGFE
jgi:hypothetical protein